MAIMRSLSHAGNRVLPGADSAIADGQCHGPERWGDSRQGGAPPFRWYRRISLVTSRPSGSLHEQEQRTSGGFRAGVLTRLLAVLPLDRCLYPEVIAVRT